MTQPVSQPSSPRAEEQEVVYYEGRPQFRADQTSVLLFGLLGIALVVVGVLSMVLTWGIPVLVGLAMIAAGVLAVLIPWWLTRLTRYRISSHRIDYEHGLLTKRIETMELWHVDDISFQQGLIDRMFNVGTIAVLSDDKTTPRLELHGIPNPRAIFDSLKSRVITAKRQRGVIKVDTGE